MKQAPALFAFAVALCVYGWSMVRPTLANLHGNDFNHMYFGARAMLDEGNPYDARELFAQVNMARYQGTRLNPYVYLPFTGLAMSPLILMELPQAKLSWYIFNQVLWLAILYLISRMFGKARWLIVMSIALALSAFSMPLFRTFTSGQLNLVLLFCIVAAAASLDRFKHTAPLLLGFAAAFKIAPALLGAWFLATRRWRSALLMVVGFVVLMVASVAIVGWETHTAFLPVLNDMGYGKSTWAELGYTFWKDPFNQSANSFFTHIMIYDDDCLNYSHQALANLYTWIVSVGLMTVSFIVCRKVFKSSYRFRLVLETQYAVLSHLVLLMLLLPSLYWDHYIIMTVFPIAVLANHAARGKRFGDLLRMVGLAILALWLHMPFNFVDVNLYEGFQGFLLMSFKLWPTLILFFATGYHIIQLVTAASTTETRTYHKQTEGQTFE